jgi:hypothetical protein
MDGNTRRWPFRLQQLPTILSCVISAAWLCESTVDGAAAAGSPPKPETPLVRLGLFADPHYADKAPAGSRYYRDSLAKLDAAKQQFARSQVDFVVALGDEIDSGPTRDEERGYLRRIHEFVATFPGRRHYVLGNHCVESLTKAEFLETVGQARTYYSFDHGGWHFVVLDGCFRHDGAPYGRKNSQWTDSNLPPDQVDWLRADLQQAAGRSVVFLHQRLDGTDDHAIRNAAVVRQVLEQSGKVAAVFQGHYHKGGYTESGSIHYNTLPAMVEGPSPKSNAFAVVSLFADGRVRVDGFGKQPSYEWPKSGTRPK